MTAITEKLHRAFLRPLGDAVLRHSPAGDKPLSVDLALPNPPRLRVYMYTLVGGVGTVRPNEYKAVLRVPGQAVGAYDSFDLAAMRNTLPGLLAEAEAGRKLREQCDILQGYLEQCRECRAGTAEVDLKAALADYDREVGT